MLGKVLTKVQKTTDLSLYILPHEYMISYNRIVDDFHYFSVCQFKIALAALFTSLNQLDFLIFFVLG